MGAVFGIALGLALGNGAVAPALTILVLAAALAAIARAVVPDLQWRGVALLADFAFAVRAASAMILHTGSVALGCGGFITGDDADYATLSWAFVSFLRGDPLEPVVPPYWGGHAYLFGPFVYLESVIFYLLGPQVLAVQLLNAALGAGLVIVVFAIVRRLFDAHAAMLAAAVVAFFPSLILWSALNLKDALALVLIGAFFYLLQRFMARPSVPTLALALVPLIPMLSLRPYVYTLLALVLPAGVFGARLSGTRRVGWVATALVASVLALSQSPIRPTWSDVWSLFERTRQSMALGARTAYLERPPIRVEDGDTFVVTTPTKPAVGSEDRPAGPACMPLGSTLAAVPRAPRHAVPAAASPSSTAGAGAPAPVSARPIAASLAPAASPAPTSQHPAPAAAVSPVATMPPTPASPTPSPTDALAVAAPMSSVTPTRTPTAPSASPAGRTPLPAADFGAARSASAAPTVMVVSPGTRIALAPTFAPPPQDSSVRYVRPGDVIVVVREASPASPAPQPRVLLVPQAVAAADVSAAVGANRMSRVADELIVTLGETGEPFGRTLVYFPKGIAYALLAPFPWKPARPLDLLTVPEILLWYLMLPSLLWSLWRMSGKRLLVLPMALFVGGALTVFALAEGNVGTLYRHRAMVIPFAAILASPGLVALARSLSGRLRRRSRE